MRGFLFRGWRHAVPLCFTWPLMALTAGAETSADDPAAKVEIPVPAATTRGAEVWMARAPLESALWPHAGHPVNRDRIYDFYAKEADYFAAQPDVLDLILPEYPGMDGGSYGHWGNQNEEVWKDGRWNLTDHGSVVSNVFRGAGMTIPKAVCVRLGEHGGLAAVFNTATATFDVVWSGGFVTFSNIRHGFMDGATLEGAVVTASRSGRAPLPIVYHGFYRHGLRTIFTYRVGETELLDLAWEEGGGFLRAVEPADAGELSSLTHGGPAQWPQVLETRGVRGTSQSGVAIDTLTPPFDNPWKTLFFLGGHDFFPDGSAAVCTLTGEVWTVRGIDTALRQLRWKRFATGLHQPLGMRIVDGKIHVLGRNQITRLHDLNGDGEADFYECVTNVFETSPGGHDFITGLERDTAGNWYFASATQGLCRVLADGNKVEVLATGFRNANGVAVAASGEALTNAQEGEWSNASAIFQVMPVPGQRPYFGYGGPKEAQPVAKPLMWFPRGMDNATGGACFVEPPAAASWLPWRNSLLSTSWGAGIASLVLRDTVGGVTQGCAVALPGEFRSGPHRGRFSPADGSLYISGSGGWGTYTPDDGCLQRVRLTSIPLLPNSWQARDNGVLLRFPTPLDRTLADEAKNHFAQVWNYRYAADYGSPEYSVMHPGVPGHDALEIHSAQILEGGRGLFLEIPQLRPVNQLHLRLRVGGPRPLDLFATVHALGPVFTDFTGYQPIAKMATASAPLIANVAPARENPWAKGTPGRPIAIEAALGLQFATKRLTAAPGEALSLTFTNPDFVPHNFVLVNPGSLTPIGEQINKLIAQPGAAARHYVPDSPDVIVWTDMTNPKQSTTIHFNAPNATGEYPYLCSFPGHWQVMNGVLAVE